MPLSHLHRLISHPEGRSFHRVVVGTVAITLLVQMLISLPLWIPIGREFPMIGLLGPSSGGYGSVPDILLVLMLLGGLLLQTIDTTSRFGLLMVTFAAILLVIEDLNRLQPWFYLSMILLWIIPRPPRRRPFAARTPERDASRLRANALFPSEEDDRLLLARLLLLIAGVYIWSGLFKLNPYFGADIIPWMFDPLGLDLHGDIGMIIGWPVALFELSCGAALFFGRTRTIAAFGLIAIHLFIILSLLLHNWNLVVIPWNLQLIFFLLLLVVRFHEDNLSSTLHSSFLSFPMLLIGLAGYLLPLLSLFGYWPHHLSWGLYSGISPDAIFYYSESDRETFSEVPERFLYFIEGSPTEYLLIHDWAMEDLHVPFYSEPIAWRVFVAQMTPKLSHPESAGIKAIVVEPFTGISTPQEIRKEER